MRVVECAAQAKPFLCDVERGVLLCAPCGRLHEVPPSSPRSAGLIGVGAQSLLSATLRSLVTLPAGWSPSNIETLKSVGNARANLRYEAHLVRSRRPPFAVRRR